MQQENKASYYSRRLAICVAMIATFTLKLQIIYAQENRQLSTTSANLPKFVALGAEQNFETWTPQSSTTKITYDLATTPVDDSIVMRTNETVEVSTLSPSTTTTESQSNDELLSRFAVGQSNGSIGEPQVAIDVNRRLFETHDQLTQTSADSQKQRSVDDVPSKTARVSSFLTARQQQSSLLQPANTSSSSSVTSLDLSSARCPGICRSVLTAPFLCQNEIVNARCASAYQRCCDPNDGFVNATPVETSAPLANVEPDLGLPTESGNSSIDAKTSEHVLTTLPPIMQASNITTSSTNSAESNTETKTTADEQTMPVYFLSSIADSDLTSKSSAAQKPTNDQHRVSIEPNVNVLTSGLDSSVNNNSLAAHSIKPSQSFELPATNTTQTQFPTTTLVPITTIATSTVSQENTTKRPVPYVSLSEYQQRLAANAQRAVNYHPNTEETFLAKQLSACNGLCMQLNQQHFCSSPNFSLKCDSSAMFCCMPSNRTTTQAPTLSNMQTSTTTSSLQIADSNVNESNSTQNSSINSNTSDLSSRNVDNSQIDERNANEQNPQVGAVGSVLAMLFDSFVGSGTTTQPPPLQLQPTMDEINTNQPHNDRRVGYDMSDQSVSSNDELANAAGELTPANADSDPNAPVQPTCSGYCAHSLFALLCDATYMSADCGPSRKCCAQAISSTQSPSSQDVNESQNVGVNECAANDFACLQSLISERNRLMTGTSESHMQTNTNEHPLQQQHSSETDQKAVMSKELLASLIPQPPPEVVDLIAAASANGKTQLAELPYQQRIVAQQKPSTIVIDESQVPALMEALQQQQHQQLVRTQIPWTSQPQQTTPAPSQSGIMSHIYQIFRPGSNKQSTTTSTTSTTTQQPRVLHNQQSHFSVNPSFLYNKQHQHQQQQLQLQAQQQRLALEQQRLAAAAAVAAPPRPQVLEQFSGQATAFAPATIVQASPQFNVLQNQNGFQNSQANYQQQQLARQKLQQQQQQYLQYQSSQPQLPQLLPQQQVVANQQAMRYNQYQQQAPIFVQSSQPPQAQIQQQQNFYQAQRTNNLAQQQQQQQQLQQQPARVQHQQLQQSQLQQQPMQQPQQQSQRQQQANVNSFSAQANQQNRFAGQSAKPTLNFDNTQTQSLANQQRQQQANYNDQQLASSVKQQQQQQQQLQHSNDHRKLNVATKGNQATTNDPVQKNIGRVVTVKPPIKIVTSAAPVSNKSKQTIQAAISTDQQLQQQSIRQQEQKQQLPYDSGLQLSSSAVLEQKQSPEASTKQTSQSQTIDDVTGNASSVSIRVSSVNATQSVHSQQPSTNAPPETKQTQVAQATPTCGMPHARTARRQQRVIGGFDVTNDDYCWQAALMNERNEYLCGGTLIGDKWVLTAGHCVTQHLRNESQLLVRVGQLNLNANMTDGLTARVKTTYINHNHNSETLDNDIALLKLETAVPIGGEEPAICAACLPERGSSPTLGKYCTVTGFGYETEDGPAALRMRQTRVPIVADDECTSKTSEALKQPFALPANSFCAGGELGNDACAGDGGSPLACQDDSGIYEVTGIVSWGYKCATSVPSVYVRVSAFVGWINQIVSVNN